MRSAAALSTVYTDLNLDLLIAGILFHDCGKLWENSYPEDGFSQPYDLEGEMLGHIPLGLTLVTELWHKMIAKQQATPSLSQWDQLTPATDHVRIHLLHLIAAHHGTHEFGSPTLPRTPEAHALHHIDNLDAKYEMLSQAYRQAPELAPGILERQFPLPANLITPLPTFNPEILPEPEELGESPLPEIEDVQETKPYNGELF